MRRLVKTPRLIAAAAREVRRADRGGTLLATFYQLLGAVAALGVVAAGKLTFDALLTPDHAAVGLTPALLLLALATAVSGSVGPLQTQQHRILGERVSQRVWDRLLDTTARADLVTYESTGFATALERVRQHALTRPFAVTAALLGLTGSLLGVTAMSVVLLAVEPLLLPLLLAAGIPAVLLARWASRTEFAFAHRLTALFRRRHYLQELLTQRPYAAEVRAFDATGPLRARHDALNADVNAALSKQVRRRQLIAALTTLGVATALTGALLAIVQLVQTGRIDLAEAGAAAIAVRLLSGQLGTLFGAIGGLLESAPFLADLERFVASGPEAGPRGHKHDLVDRVSLRGARFSYPGLERPAVDGVDLEIRAGEVVALVGENGSGKTTLAKIVAGLYEPDDGVRRWDGTAMPAPDVRASVTVIFQDFVRYQMTVRDNIVISGDGVDPEAAARSAGLLPTVRGLPDGMDTMLGRDLDEGVDLSGGQWQRVALARALHRDTPLIVLDEPAAALDPRAEHELFTNVRATLGGRAALLISHRFSSTRMADRIYVMDAGRVVECGTHDELMAAAGQYAELYRLQSAAYR
ncbi:ABC transporter ATP-binding protein [Actinophytocola algeriensis]|uniref:ATP-binding cassette subfamily B protein n=1 Tax=Actinophytocola algeriensis TaxID=1768010 RepID=A0A7W7Q3I8_9PSEU|nr:ABC transporter ATP-binding protein [Actinophytocola algeriensis]MBB4906279.1 ATP-binding cassette subfamily B protein [Actinophytocola algeriensis]MBE1477760.1 ATP-binding cassette subfamily B protein [Actinophytocola algeriensis]